MVIAIPSSQALPTAAAQLLEAAGSSRIFLFYGGMGVGKTTFINAICQKLGITDTTSSPTFAIVNEYASPAGAVYHFDFYRIKSEQEAFDLGYEEYFYSGNYCFIEWPERIANLLPPDAVSIRMESDATGKRQCHVTLP